MSRCYQVISQLGRDITLCQPASTLNIVCSTRTNYVLAELFLTLNANRIFLAAPNIGLLALNTFCHRLQDVTRLRRFLQYSSCPHLYMERNVNNTQTGNIKPDTD